MQSGTCCDGIARIAAAVESNVPANIDLVSRVFEAFTRRDVDAMLELCAPDIEFWGPTASFAHAGDAYVGHEGMREYFADVARLWRVLEVVPHDFRDLGDRVLVFGRVYARGAGGYISDSPTQWLWRVRADQVVWGRVFTNRAEALAAAGLDE
jgi:ketosteroid isomerase-like protein